MSISGSQIPGVSISKFGVLQHNDQVTLLCNVTEAQSSKTPLKRISWYKDGFRLQTVCCPVPNIPEDTLGPLLVKDGGNYSCVVEVLLRNIKEYNVSDYTVVRCEFHYTCIYVFRRGLFAGWMTQLVGWLRLGIDTYSYSYIYRIRCLCWVFFIFITFIRSRRKISRYICFNCSWSSLPSREVRRGDMVDYF